MVTKALKDVGIGCELNLVRSHAESFACPLILACLYKAGRDTLMHTSASLPALLPFALLIDTVQWKTCHPTGGGLHDSENNKEDVGPLCHHQSAGPAEAACQERACCSGMI